MTLGLKLPSRHHRDTETTCDTSLYLNWKKKKKDDFNNFNKNNRPHTGHIWVHLQAPPSLTLMSSSSFSTVMLIYLFCKLFLWLHSYWHSSLPVVVIVFNNIRWGKSSGALKCTQDPFKPFCHFVVLGMKDNNHLLYVLLFLHRLTPPLMWKYTLQVPALVEML